MTNGEVLKRRSTHQGTDDSVKSLVAVRLILSVGSMRTESNRFHVPLHDWSIFDQSVPSRAEDYKNLGDKHS